MVHELRVERTKRKAWTVQEHYYIFQVIFWGQMLSLALSSSSFLHNHALCQLQAVLLAINTTFIVFCWLFTFSIWQVQCQGLSLISRFRYSHTLCICHCFFSGCLHFGEWHSTLGRASAVSGNTTASQIIVSRPRVCAQCAVHSAQPFLSTSYVQCASNTS